MGMKKKNVKRKERFLKTGTPQWEQQARKKEALV